MQGTSTLAERETEPTPDRTPEPTPADSADPGSAARSPAQGWRLNVLGPVELCYDGNPVQVSGPTRTLMALIARSPGQETITTDIIAGIWGDTPPEDAEKEVASHVSRLRKALTVVAPNVDPTRVIVTLPAGYILDIQPSNADILAFERLVADGRRALTVGEPELALARLDAALALWRGAAYEDFGDHAFAHAEAARLDELRLTAVETRLQARLAVAAPGVPDGLEAELHQLIAVHWYRERLWVLLMTALFRSGRRGDALAVCRQAQARLAQAPGGATGPDLRDTERAVIASDPALHGVARTPVALPPALAPPGPACVGRDDELTWLLTALDLAATRRAQVRLIVGGPGLGKTRLLAEVARRAGARGIRTRYWRAGGHGLDTLALEPDRLNVVMLDDLDQASHEDLVAATTFVRAARSHPVVVLVTCRDPVRVGDLHGVPKVVLSGLDDEAVAEIVRTYAPATATATAAAAMVNAGGVPARVHRHASEWAFQRAGRRIDRAVADAGRPLQRLEATESEVVGGVLDLAYVRDRARALLPAPRPSGQCPYAGPGRFEVGQAEMFHGRERLVADALARLVRAPLLAVVGDGGTGKSSMVRAGLLPALTAGVLPDSGRWHRVLVTPASVRGPLAAHLQDRAAAHATALAAAADADAEADAEAEAEAEVVTEADVAPEADGETADGVVESPPPSAVLLLVVDQFDEVFTALDPAERDEFVAAVLATAQTGRVVVTMRPQTYARCVAYPELTRLLGANTLLVPAMTTAELHAAVRRPADVAGLDLSPGLADRIVADATAAPGDLTSLSTALRLTWANRTGRTLTPDGYAAGGGVTGAVERYAEAVYAGLSAPERDTARAIVVPLAEREGGPVELAAVLTSAGPGGSAVLERLTEGGLLRLTETDGVELITADLARRWPRLRGWIEQSADEDGLHRHLTQSATAWADAGRSTADLYRGARLVAALDWAAAHPGEVGAVEREYLHAGERLVLATENRRRRRVVLLWKWLAATLVVAVLAVAVATFAVVQQLRADAAAGRADAARVAAMALAEPDLRLALLLSVAAAGVDPDRIDGVRAVLSRAPDLVAAGGEAVTAVAVSPDGQRVAAGSRNGEVLLLPAGLLGTATVLEGGPAPVNGLTFAPDGRRLVGWGGGGTTDPARTGIAVWDPEAAAPIGAVFGDAALAAGGGLASDGVTLIVVRPGAGAVPWNIDARTPSTAYPLPDGVGDFLALSADGRVVALGGPGSGTTDGGATVVEVATGETADVPGLRPLALSADGTRLLGARGRDLVVWSVSERASVGTATGSLADLTVAAWSPDGRTFASAAADGSITVWDAQTRRPVRVLTGHDFAAHTLAYAPDGRTLYSAGADGAVLAWDLTGGRGLGSTVAADAGPEQIVRSACAAAGRELSRDEWARFLPGHSYRHVCPT